MKSLAAAAMLFACLVVSLQVNAQTYQKVYAFADETDGSDITSTLTMDRAGNFYGTAFSGGTSYGTACDLWGGCGLVFRLSATGTKTTLHNFGLTSTDGQNPKSGVVVDASGNIFGTTVYGGTSGLGTIFKIDTHGRESILHSFAGQADGAYPIGGLLLASDGNLYGTAQQGGDLTKCSGGGCGTVFKVTPTGILSVLYSFTGGADGAAPMAALISDGQGNFLGTAATGGVNNNGVVYQIDAAGNQSVIHTFAGAPNDGAQPSAALFRDPFGNLYSTTTRGGNADLGSIFKIDPSGTEFVLHSFLGAAGRDGQYPNSGVIVSPNGDIYGTASIGGSHADGVVFKIVFTGRETILHNFAGSPGDGAEPDATLIRDRNGNLWGAAAIGGPGDCPPGLGVGCGVIYKLSK